MEAIRRFFGLVPPDYPRSPRGFKNLSPDPSVEANFAREFGRIDDPALRGMLAKLSSELPTRRRRPFSLAEIQDVMHRSFGVERNSTLFISVNLRWQDILSSEPTHGAPRTVFYAKPQSLALAAVIWERSLLDKSARSKPQDENIKEAASRAKEKLAGSSLSGLLITSEEERRKAQESEFAIKYPRQRRRVSPRQASPLVPEERDQAFTEQVDYQLALPELPPTEPVPPASPVATKETTLLPEAPSPVEPAPTSLATPAEPPSPPIEATPLGEPPAPIEPIVEETPARPHRPTRWTSGARSGAELPLTGFSPAERFILEQLTTRGKLPISDRFKDDIPDINEKLTKMGFYITVVNNEYVLRKST